MKYKNLTIWVVLFSLLPIISFSQRLEEDKAMESDFQAFWEVTPSFLASYVLDDKKTYFAMEQFTNYWFQKDWAAGVSFSEKFVEDIVLFDMAFLGSYKPKDWVTINSGLNIGFPHDEYRRELEPGFYLESEFNYEVKKNFEAGLVVGTILSKNSEIFGGLHLDFEFPVKNPVSYQ